MSMSPKDFTSLPPWGLKELCSIVKIGFQSVPKDQITKDTHEDEITQEVVHAILKIPNADQFSYMPHARRRKYQTGIVDIGIIHCRAKYANKIVLDIEAKCLAKNKFTYVSGKGGGIARFKLGIHGKGHANSIMLGYVMEREFCYWLKRINDNIERLSSASPKLWSKGDKLGDLKVGNGMAETVSSHKRCGARNPIRITHFWQDLSNGG